MSFVAEFRQAIEGAQHILAVTHVGPDGDALGSLTAVGQALSRLGKQITMACDSDMPSRFNYLAFIDRVVKRADHRVPYDLLIALDCGDELRMGDVYAHLPEPKPFVVNIDHHITNTYFGRLNWVADCPSTAEMIYHLFNDLGWEIDKNIAMSLLTGVVTDTLGFRTPNVTPTTLRVASALMEAGADLPLITMQTLNLKPLSTLRLWQIGLNQMKIEDGLMWTTITSRDREMIGYRNDSSSGLVNLLADVNRVAIGVVLMEMEDGTIRVGFRSRPPYDVAALAKKLGGGGHPQAAGCTMEGPLAKAEAQIIEMCKVAITQQSPADN
ncbi:MAG: bifunctional oligoribonuclease/PAP phosphatase NrnA [Ardenticatenaceae bacterium]|nr:bifunctional oligoribonuclease/PAP phosphatase NrnA [Anaerolineales bacterium]MCB8984282.1 bifunctional oligoribonuclease/PAP phosphatase NrnA [Ardenticatenaceae bacterium]MCB8987472.1 bifunctional oligoribonuclease/PAP phosphatase NrnA [Ardenticatenaceae bacterium]